MLSLARSNINHDWRMFLSAAVVLLLSGTLIFVSIGITQANIRSLTAFKRNLPVDIYVQVNNNNNNDFASLKQFLNESHIYPEVEFAEPLIDNIRTTTVLVGKQEKRLKVVPLELEKPSIAVPKFIEENVKEALQITGSAIVSSTLKLQPGFEIGDFIWDETENFALEIIGHFEAEINRSSLISQNGYAFVSNETHRLFHSNSSSYSSRSLSNRRFSTVGVRVKSSFPVDIAKRQLKQSVIGRDLKISSRRDLVRSESLKGALENKVLQGFLIFCFFAVTIPFFIIVQTLKSAILHQVKQFAIMKALGVPSWRLAGVAMEQSFWIGVLGAGLSYCGMTIMRTLFNKWNIDFFISLNTALTICLIILLGSLFAGALSISAISKAHPLDMLR